MSNSTTSLKPEPPTVTTEAIPSAWAIPELLAPAGDWECARAAVENGADAIYFGLERFNARMRAHNFTESDLPKLVTYLHSRGVKGYVTLNTLVFENELGEAEQYLRTMIAAGVDAVIVQDVGICRLIRQISPDFPIHASTQMTVTSAGGVEFARELGCSLIVLARECSIKEIEKIQQSQDQAQPPLPLEVFVHGALCVAYSGQCLTSEALGGRSANRGECAQACRMPYELISDGQSVALGDRRYLLSPQDLAGLPVLPDLVRAGVASLKIEGRLKTPEYVANVTRVYRKALDALAGHHGGVRSKSAKPLQNLPDRSRYDLEMAFSRGLYTGWFEGINNQALVHARFGKKRGVYLGQVTRISHGHLWLRLEAALKPGDGVVFDSAQPEEKEEGGRVYALTTDGDQTRLSFGSGDIDWKRVHVGDRVWKTSDPELERRLRQSYSGDKPNFQRPLSFEVHGHVGSPLTLVARDELGHVVQAESIVPLTEAHAQPLDDARLREQLGRLGGTPFRLGSLRNRLEGTVILPVSELNRLRRECVKGLEVLRAEPQRWGLLPAQTAAKRSEITAQTPSSELVILVRDLEQLQAVLQKAIGWVYCEFEDPKKYREAVRQYRALAGRARSQRGGIFVAPPRIFKPGEDWVLEQVRSSEPDGYLVRNYDHLRYFSGERCIGDYSLNVANSLTAAYFKERFGLERLTASYDLNAAQLEGLLQATDPSGMEITVHQHMPLFHMEHCVFCAFLSTGTDYRNCGRPCDKHAVELKDRVGARHPLKADAGCRNTLYNAAAQTGAEHISRLQKLGVRYFRLEFLNEPPEMVVRTVDEYQRVFRGESSGNQLWRQLKLINQLGVTRGTLQAGPARPERLAPNSIK